MHDAHNLSTADSIDVYCRFRASAGIQFALGGMIRNLVRALTQRVKKRSRKNGQTSICQFDRLDAS